MKKNLILLCFIFLLLSAIDCTQSVNIHQVNISVNVQEELFPVISKFVSEGNKNSNLPATVKWQIQNNSSDPVQLVLSSEISDWTAPSITTVTIGPNENKTFNQTPFGIKLLSKHSTVPATIILKAVMGEKNIYEETKNIKIRSADEMIWSLNSLYDTSPFITAWVTPNNSVVETVLSSAKERMFSRSLSGYQNSNIESEVRAIFNAVRDANVSYVDSRMSFGVIGSTQRVRLPEESINERSANCIDGAVLFASLFENIGLEPLIVLIPGHAFVGVRTSPGSTQTMFIETTLVGRNMLQSIFTLETTFDAAVRKGNSEYNEAIRNNPNSIRIIDIKEARQNGIYPLW